MSKVDTIAKTAMALLALFSGVIAYASFKNGFLIPFVIYLILAFLFIVFSVTINEIQKLE